MTVTKSVLFLICVLNAGCGPFVAGTWADDPKNWKRAFKEDRPPEGIEVVHSWYLRTPHFTAEYHWFFELKLSPEAKDGLRKSEDLQLLSGSDRDLELKVGNNRPDWFRPEPLPQFEMYESKSQPDFIIFIEKDGPRSFWTRRQ